MKVDRARWPKRCTQCQRWHLNGRRVNLPLCPECFWEFVSEEPTGGTVNAAAGYVDVFIDGKPYHGESLFTDLRKP